MRLSEILGRLDGVTDDHDGFLALCPAHKDRNTPSLKLTLKEGGKLLFVCRTGCDKADVLAAMRMREADLFDVVNDMGAHAISAKVPESVSVAEIAGLRAFIDAAVGKLERSSEWPERARAYAFERFGLSAEQCADLGVGVYDPGDAMIKRSWLSGAFTRYPRLTVPLTGFDGVVRGLQGRDLSGKCPARWVSLTNVDGKTWAKYGVLSAGAGYDTILVTEGPGDGLTSVGVGYDALIIRGAGLARNAVLVAELVEHLRGRDVVLAFDPDDAGARGIGALATALVEDGNAPRQLPFPNSGEDLTAWRERTPDAFAAELHRAVRTATVVELVVPASTPAPSPEVEDSLPATDAALATMDLSARQMFDNTDVGIAVMLRDFIARDGGGVRYAKGLGFLCWDGKVWAPGGEKVRESLHLLGAELIASGDDSKRRLALKALSNRSIDAVLKELPAVPGVPVDAMSFDAHDDLLSVANGTINLRTGELRPHNPADLITKRLEVAYRPEATADRWEQFLREVFPNHPEMPSFVQRLTGYGITGYTSEQLFVIHHGGGKNGKTVYTSTTSHVFKGAVQNSEFTTFEKTPEEGAPSPGLARLRGYRMVLASESEKYARLAEPLIKRLTGDGNIITTRFLHQNPFSYRPQFLLQVETNYKPAILSQDYGIWRRVKLIPWEAVFDGPKQDPQLQAKLRAESEGILAWAVRGSVEWFAHGLNEPASVSAATTAYRESEDRLQEFLNACTVREEGARVAPMAIRRTYAEWAEDAGLDRKEKLSGWALAVELESRGFKKDKRKGAWGFNGLRLMTDDERAFASRLAEVVDEPADQPTADTDIFGQTKEAA
jgi:putative DNA primase/helicase